MGKFGFDVGEVSSEQGGISAKGGSVRGTRIGMGSRRVLLSDRRAARKVADDGM